MDKDEKIWRFRLDKFGGQMSSSLSSKICMNGLCGASTTPQWKRGWPMKAGGFATLCYSCGTAYDNVNYCERFHLNEPGWRECNTCNKPIHCGCVVSKYLYQCLDLGGISCMKCLRPSATQPLKTIQSYTDIPNGFASFSGIGNWHPSVMGKRMNGGASLDKGKAMQFNGALEKHQHSPSTSSIGNQIRQDENRLSSREFSMSIPSSKDIGTISPNPSSLFAAPDNNRSNLGPKAMYEVLPQPSLGISLGNALGTPNSAAIPIPNGIVEGGEQEKVPSFKQGQRSRQTYPKPSKSGVSIRPQPSKGMVSENRVARRPAEGRGSTHLLPRYWPKITDQELLQISGDLNSNCTITPLFEKVLSASDAGRIGRLVLPKACAEAYFPPINQSDGLPIRIRDIKGKEWTFQFRFWPNNNSRMYVLEGITPCIQSMQLQAGDTVIFSRLDPEDKLVIGCRKATVAADMKEAETSALPNGGTSSGGNENLPAHEGMVNGDSVQQPDKKKTRTIGSKSKRLLMHSEDAIELKVTWEEAQELLCPPSTSKPTVVTIEDCEIEEYDEPPVFSKETILTRNATGSQEQWGQCNSCSKWRKLPSDVLPPRWTCFDNGSDPDRCSCSAPDEINMRDVEQIFRFGKESKRQRLAQRSVMKEEEKQQQEDDGPSGLDALATAAVLGESVGEFGESSVSPTTTTTTTRHPRHRPGCTCIVCIQPPSGKGKHKPNCICNVCSTVKRRFKTLMLRRKKRFSEREAETIPVKDEMGPGPLETMCMDNMEKKGGQHLDLNCDPIKEEESMSLANASGIVSVEWQKMAAGLVCCSMTKGASEIELGHPPPTDEECLSPMDEAVKLEMDNSVVEGR